MKGVMRFVLILKLIARKSDFIRIDYDNEISAVNVGRKGRLIFAAQYRRYLAGQASHRHVRRIDDIPFSGDILFIGHKSFHGNILFENTIEFRTAGSRFTPGDRNVCICLKTVSVLKGAKLSDSINGTLTQDALIFYYKRAFVSSEFSVFCCKKRFLYGFDAVKICLYQQKSVLF
jgi:hypothetical protein